MTYVKPGSRGWTRGGDMVRDEAGFVTPLSLIAFLGTAMIGGLALDLSSVVAARTQLQVAADLAAGRKGPRIPRLGSDEFRLELPSPSRGCRRMGHRAVVRLRDLQADLLPRGAGGRWCRRRPIQQRLFERLLRAFEHARLG